MSGPLVDPDVAAWQANDPAAFLERADVAELAPVPPTKREHVARDLAVAFVVVAALVVRELHRRRARDLTEAHEIVQGAWKRHLPAWVRFAAPAIRQAYVLGRVTGTPDELTLLAGEYARDLGTYIGQTSTDAVIEGLNRQLNQRWSFELAWHRAAAGYGLDRKQMHAYLRAAAAGEDSPELIPAAARVAVDRMLLVRGTRIGTDQSYTAEQSGKSLLWMKAYAEGAIPDAWRQWTMGHAEEHCGICTFLRGQKVRPDQPFVLPNGQHIWSPRVHPGCDCHILLLGADDQLIAKAGPIAAGLALRACDTGRLLMLQRALSDDDPAGGTWEFPGGHIEPGEEPLDAAKREWSEEVRRRVPIDARYVSQWASPDGKYVGAILEVPDESAVPSHRRGRVTNPDDPDGDEIEAIAWWDADHLARNPSVRAELRNSLSEFRVANRVTRNATRYANRVSKAFGSDPRTRDAHGRWASVEGRRSQAVLDRPDPGLQSIARTLQELEAKRAAEPANLTDSAPLTGRRASLTGSQSLTTQGSLTGSLGALTQRVAAERQQQMRQAAPSSIKITLKLPRVAPTPARTGYEGLYIPQGDVQEYFDEEFAGAVGAYGGGIDLGYIADWYRRRGPAEADYAHGGQIEGFQRNSPFELVAPTFEGFGDDEWEDVVADAEPVWDAVVENSGDILEVLDSEDLGIIMENAVYGEYWDPDKARRMIDQAINGPEPDHGLRDAFADYVTFFRPETLDEATGVSDGIGTEFSQRMAEAGDRTFGWTDDPDERRNYAGAQTAFRIAELAPDDNPGKMRGNYQIITGGYVSAITARREGSYSPAGHVGMKRLELVPADE